MPVDLEKPYLTESGPNGFDEMRVVYDHRLGLLIGEDSFTSGEHLVSMSQITRDALSLLIGLPSTSFHLSQVGFQLFHFIVILVFS